MVTRKTSAIAFIGILITVWLMVFITQVEAETPDEQKQALIGEWVCDKFMGMVFKHRLDPPKNLPNDC